MSLLRYPKKWSKPDHTASAAMMMPDPRRCHDTMIMMIGSLSLSVSADDGG